LIERWRRGLAVEAVRRRGGFARQAAAAVIYPYDNPDRRGGTVCGPDIEATVSIGLRRHDVEVAVVVEILNCERGDVEVSVGLGERKLLRQLVRDRSG
jgi:hypothetical protein